MGPWLLNDCHSVSTVILKYTSSTKSQQNKAKHELCAYFMGCTLPNFGDWDYRTPASSLHLYVWKVRYKASVLNLTSAAQIGAHNMASFTDRDYWNQNRDYGMDE